MSKQGRRGLGASLWAWLNKPGAQEYWRDTLDEEVEKRKKAEAKAVEFQRLEAGALHDLAVERCSHRDTRTKLDASERELAKLRETYATHLAAHTDLVVWFAQAVSEKADAIRSADLYLSLAESYAADVDGQRQLMANACNQLDGRAHHPVTTGGGLCVGYHSRG